LCSGVGWAIAQISWFVANDRIHFVGTFPLVSTGPGIVATLCAIVFYREIQGKRNYAFLGATAGVVIIGVILIALSLPAGS
jgi:glucose uptake protein GlcU